jgi:hypothetical protein
MSTVYELHAQRNRSPLDRRELANTAGHGWIANDRHAGDAWRYILEQLKPFRAQGELECGKSSDVAAGLRQARDEASTDGITHVYEYNRDGARCLLQRTHGRIAVRYNHVRRLRDEFRRISLQQADITPAPAIFDVQVATLAPAQLLQSLRERRHAAR